MENQVHNCPASVSSSCGSFSATSFDDSQFISNNNILFLKNDELTRRRRSSSSDICPGQLLPPRHSTDSEVASLGDDPSMPVDFTVGIDRTFHQNGNGIHHSPHHSPHSHSPRPRPHHRANHTTNSTNGSSSNGAGERCYSATIQSHEVVEQRAKCTVFKIQVSRGDPFNSWFVFRRYSDFHHLSVKLRKFFPGVRFALPPKRWFGSNFDLNFLEDRQIGLQTFVDSICNHPAAKNSDYVRDFFCVDEPPGPHDSLDESRALCDALEQVIHDLHQQLFIKDQEISDLKQQVSFICEQYNLPTALSKKSKAASLSSSSSSANMFRAVVPP